MISEQNKAIAEAIHSAGLNTYKTLHDYLEMAKAIAEPDGDNDLAYALEMTREIKEIVPKLPLTQEFNELYWQAMLFEAPYRFESFMLYMEKNRPPEEKFYQPRINPLKQVADAIQDLADDKLDELFINMPSRVGKLLSDDTPILTSKGWKNHGDLVVGDEVIGSDGGYTKIVYVHPKFNTTHTVTMSDGTNIECHFRHEWTVYDRRCGKWRILETQKLIGHLKNGKRNNFLLPFKPVVHGGKKNLIVDPYVFGAWLGDGSNQKARISGAESDSLIIDEIDNRGYKISHRYIHKTTGVISTEFELLKTQLRKMGMCNRSRRVEKHIPQEYFVASVEQRLDLLAGLIDTDGCLRRKERRYDFTTCEESLKEDFISLVSTFGWRCSVKEVQPHVSSSGIVGKKVYWTISFNPTMHIPCKLERKKLYGFSKQRHISIDKIIESPHKSGNCITVENKDGIYLAGKKLVPTHNTQIVKFAFVWFGSRNPEMSNLYTAYSDKITSGFYDGIKELITDPTYCYSEIFPDNTINGFTDGKDLTVDINRKRTYPTFTCRSIYGTLNGACDCSGLAIADDLFSGIEEAVSIDRQATVWGKFDNNFMKRLKKKAKLINMGTRWAIGDCQGRRRDLLENNLEFKDRRYKVISIPALDENDESNFDYPYDVGYSTQDYRMTRASFEENDDMASWYAQDQQEPIERQGAVFTSGNMKFFNPKKDLPDREPDRVFMAVDIAHGGGDYVSAPICLRYDDEYYIIDVVFDKGDKFITRPMIVEKVLKYRVQAGRFEETKATSDYREWIVDELKKQEYRFNATGKAASSKVAKRDRIFDKAPEIREMYFLETQFRPKEYQKFMQNIYSFKMEGKVKNDDAPDSMAQLCEMKTGSVAGVQVWSRSALGI